jgi:citrate/tricarballylate utilization protein
MPSVELVKRGAQTMTVCNSCRYCEQYCPVFPAIERRLTFDAGDLAYLSNLCHNCGECLYACQYAPPHEFGIDVPRTFAELRIQSYEDYCWPPALARAFQRQGALTALALAAGFSAVLFALTASLAPVALTPRSDAAFYSVMPHGVMVGVFGGVGGFVLIAIGVALHRFWRAIAEPDAPRVGVPALIRAFTDAATLRHLHASGSDCVSSEEARTPWRRWWHHATFGGFVLCFASTSVAAAYHSFFGWEAPYSYTSAPVILGTVGGVGLVVGPVGQWWQCRLRDPALAAATQHGMDDALMLLLWLTSTTGLALLLLRTTALMASLLLVHLGVVLALFVTLPYGKFVHGFYRLLALAKDAAEDERDRSRQRRPSEPEPSPRP